MIQIELLLFPLLLFLLLPLLSRCGVSAMEFGDSDGFSEDLLRGLQDTEEELVLRLLQFRPVLSLEQRFISFISRIIIVFLQNLGVILSSLPSFGAETAS